MGIDAGQGPTRLIRVVAWHASRGVTGGKLPNMCVE